MYPFILLVSLAALVMGILNARNVFGVPAHGLELLQPRLDHRRLGARPLARSRISDPRAILGLAIGTLIGGALQLLVQLPALRRAGYRYHPGS